MIHGINDDRALRYEGAAEILNTMIAQTSRDIADEELKAQPDMARIARLNEERRRFAGERRRLDPDDTQAIQHVYEEYAPLLKQRFTQQAS
jgi:hypothetical protein